MSQNREFPWKVYGSELVGTALLVFVGLSIVIADFGRGSLVAAVIPDEGLRRFITGFLFGTTGALIAISPFGKESGAHINPVVTLGFWTMGRFRADQAAGYVFCQLAGAALGAVPLLVWGDMGQSVQFGATIPAFGDTLAFTGETITTFAMVFLLFFFLRHRALKLYTPALFPPLYAIMVWLEAPISGTSTNPARTFGPSLVAGNWHGWWVYWLGPALGALLAVGAHRLARHHLPWIDVAKIHHFAHDPYRVFQTRENAR